MLIVVHLILIILELAGFFISVGQRGAGILAYYTELSNIAGLLSSIMLIVIQFCSHSRPGDGSRRFPGIMRYLACCMLVMTFLVTLFILTPATGWNFKRMFFSGSQLYHHLLCPVLHFACFLLLEKNIIRKGDIRISVALTLIYGLVMISLNWMGIYDGPYPFFQVHRIGIPATVLWVIVLMGVITFISWAVMELSQKRRYR